MAPRAPESGPAPPRRWTRHLRSHLLQFEAPPAVELSARACHLLFLAAVCLELLRMLALEWLSPDAPLGLLLPALLAAVLLGMPIITGLHWRQLGLRPWREWSIEQKWYCGQVLVLAVTAFLVMLSGPAGPPRSLATVFLPYLCYGFGQELIYRGMLQAALVRRAGPGIGILLANALFTFGPLHWNHFQSPAARAVPMFAAIFAIGLFFGVLYLRSGNLWLPASFHAVGNVTIVWSQSG